MRYRVNDQIVFQQPPGGPLVPWLSGYAEALNAQRFPHETIVSLRRRPPVAFAGDRGDFALGSGRAVSVHQG